MEPSGILPLALHHAAERNEYPLVSSRAHYHITDVQLLANITQSYVSEAAKDAEICYAFPLPPDASVCSFKAVLDGTRTIQGVVKGKHEAKTEYQEAVSQGKTAALLQQHNVEVFQVSLGNIKPKQSVEIHISFVSMIAHDAGALDSLRLMFPSVIAPRYGLPPNYDAGDIQADTNYLEVTVAIEMTSPIKSVTSPSHPIAVALGTFAATESTAFDPRRAHVQFSSQSALDQDIVLVLSCEGLDRPRCTVESSVPEEGSGDCTDAYALTLVPKFDAPALPRQEYIFLVDRSGSMEGKRIIGVRKALQIMLRSLPSRDTTFNIMSFGSDSSTLWPSSVSYTSESVAEASRHVDTMEADYGGTEMRAAFETVFSSRRSASAGDTAEKIPTAVFILTDGGDWEVDQVIKTIQGAVSEAKAKGELLRVFGMGIGDTVSKAMCDGIARAGNGVAVFVGEDESPNQKLIGLLKAARGDVLENFSVDWGVQEDSEEDFEMVPPPNAPASSKPDSTPEIDIRLFDEMARMATGTPELGPEPSAIILGPPPRVQQAPGLSSLPPMYPGVRTSLFAIIKRSITRNSRPVPIVRIKGTLLGRPVSLEVPVVPTNVVHSEGLENSTAGVLHTLAARALILDFEDSRTNTATSKAEILRLGIKYGLASSQTAFVAVDEGGIDSQETGYATNVYKSNQIGRGQGGGGLGVEGARRHRKILPVLDCECEVDEDEEEEEDEEEGEDEEESDGAEDMGFSLEFGERVSDDGISPEAGTKKPLATLHSGTTTTIPGLEEIARAQAFDGSFPDCSFLFNFSQQGVKDAILTPPDTLFNVLQDEPDAKRILWSTALCIAWLELFFGAEKEAWDLIVEKAKAYANDAVNHACQDAIGFVENLLGEAKRSLDGSLG